MTGCVEFAEHGICEPEAKDTPSTAMSDDDNVSSPRQSVIPSEGHVRSYP